MSKVIQFPNKQDEFIEDETANLVVNVEELLSEWPMESILLALFESATEQADIDLIMPSVAPIIAKHSLTISDGEVY